MKQFIEIEVPQGKKAIYKDGTIVFEDIDILETLTSVTDVIKYLHNNDLGNDILDLLNSLDVDSFEYNVVLLRAIICACTNSEKLSLTKGNIWYPIVQFCILGKESKCLGKEIVGHIQSEGRTYTVMGGSTPVGSTAGLGYFYSFAGISFTGSSLGFQAVSSKRVAEHISKHFGKVIFNIMYGGCNCDWKWID